MPSAPPSKAMSRRAKRAKKTSRRKRNNLCREKSSPSNAPRRAKSANRRRATPPPATKSCRRKSWKSKNTIPPSAATPCIRRSSNYAPQDQYRQEVRQARHSRESHAAPQAENLLHARRARLQKRDPAPHVRDRPGPHPAAQIYRPARALPAPHDHRHQARAPDAVDEVK